MHKQKSWQCSACDINSKTLPRYIPSASALAIFVASFFICILYSMLSFSMFQTKRQMESEKKIKNMINLIIYTIYFIKNRINPLLTQCLYSFSNKTLRKQARQIWIKLRWTQEWKGRKKYIWSKLKTKIEQQHILTNSFVRMMRAQQHFAVHISHWIYLMTIMSNSIASAPTLSAVHFYFDLADVINKCEIRKVKLNTFRHQQCFQSTEMRIQFTELTQHKNEEIQPNYGFCVY